LDILAGQVFQAQTQVCTWSSRGFQPLIYVVQILSMSQDYQQDDVQGAQILTNWIMNITKKRLDPKAILGRRFVGEWHLFRSTARYDLYTSKFVTNETVVIKALRDKIDGRDIKTQIPVSLQYQTPDRSRYS
jgi:hypothetical protein